MLIVLLTKKNLPNIYSTPSFSYPLTQSNVPYSFSTCELAKRWQFPAFFRNTKCLRSCSESPGPRILSDIKVPSLNQDPVLSILLVFFIYLDELSTPRLFCICKCIFILFPGFLFPTSQGHPLFLTLIQSAFLPSLLPTNLSVVLSASIFNSFTLPFLYLKMEGRGPSSILSYFIYQCSET